MKKFTKILSLVLALSLVTSLFAVNVMAASTAHTITLSAEPATGLKAGDTFILTITMDNTLKLQSADYGIMVDDKGLEIDNGKTSKVFNCIDLDWRSEMLNEEGGATGDWFKYYLGEPSFNATTNSITVGWMGKPENGGVAAEDARDNRVIGKFKVKVKADAVDGEYTISMFQGVTCDQDEKIGADMVCAPVTVTVGEAKDDTPEFDGATGNVTEDGKIGVEGTKEDATKVTYDNAYSVSVSMKNGENADKVGVKFIPSDVLGTNNNDWASAAEAVFTSGLGGGVTGFTAALINIPAKFRETGIEIQARAFMVVGGVEKLDENIVKKTVKWDITADRD